MLYRVGALQMGGHGAAGRGVPGPRGFQKIRRRGVDALGRQGVRPGRALGVPHGRGLGGVAGHGVAGAGAVFGGELSVLHDLLYFGSPVLEPDFDLEAEEGEERLVLFEGGVGGVFQDSRVNGHSKLIWVSNRVPPVFA